MNTRERDEARRIGIRRLATLLQEPRTLVMGVLNVTPDSFSNGGRYLVPAAACSRARRMIEAGADIIDIGAESSRPGAEPVSAEEELRRLEGVLPAVCAADDIVVSVDTQKAEVARWAVGEGAVMVNDVTALRADPAVADIVAESGCFVVLMHMLGTPQTMQSDPRYDDVVDELKTFFEERIAFARSRGIAHDRILIDPGIGFGKTVAHNLELLRRLDEFNSLGCPVLVGTSRKSFIGAVLELPVDDRLEGTAGSVACAVMNGARVVRVHDVRAMVRVVKVVDAVLGRKTAAATSWDGERDG